MPYEPINLPEVPEFHCFDAEAAHVFIQVAAQHLGEMATSPDKTRSDGTTLTDKEFANMKIRVRMAADYLLDYMTDCPGCLGDEQVTECPRQDALAFVRSMAEVHLIQ